MSSPDKTHSVLVLSDHPHAELISHAQFVESLGFSCFWYSDARFYHEPYVGLAAVAMSTTKIRLGPAVADPKTRHPALIASAVNSLNELSNGRAILGFGAGSSGFRNLGLSRDKSALAMREAIAVIDDLLSGRRSTLHGRTTYIDAANMLVPTSPVPICIAADGPLTLRLAGSVADSVMIPHCGSVELLAAKLRYVSQGAEDAGRDTVPRVVIRIDASIDDDRAAALHAGKRALARMLWRHYPHVAFLETLGIALPDDLARRLEEAGPYVYDFDLRAYERFVDAIPNEMLAPAALAGTKEDVARQVLALFDGGASEICILAIPADGQTDRDVVAAYADGLDLTKVSAGNER